MGDCLQTGKPPRCRTRHLCLLSPSHPSVGRYKWVHSDIWGSKKAHRMIHTLGRIRGFAVWAVSGWGLASSRCTGSDRALDIGVFAMMRYTNPRLLNLL